MKFRIEHTTRYQYSQPVALCHNEAHLRLRSCPEQVCESSQLRVTPAPARLHERFDYFGNPCTYFVIQEGHQELVVTATSTVTRKPAAHPCLPGLSMPWEDVQRLLREAEAQDLREDMIEAQHLLLESPFIPISRELADFAALSFVSGRPFLDAVQDLNSRIHREFAYDSGFTTIATPLSEVLQQRRGVCQDFAHLAIGCLRSLGFAARYVSGYIETVPPPGQPRLQGSDATHAWFAALDPGSGWVQFDPTNNQMVGDHHVITAWGRDYSDVTPLKGVILGGGQHEMEVSVDMVRIEER